METTLSAIVCVMAIALLFFRFKFKWQIEEIQKENDKRFTDLCEFIENELGFEYDDDVLGNMMFRQKTRHFDDKVMKITEMPSSIEYLFVFSGLKKMPSHDVDIRTNLELTNRLKQLEKFLDIEYKVTEIKKEEFYQKKTNDTPTN